MSQEENANEIPTKGTVSNDDERKPTIWINPNFRAQLLKPTHTRFCMYVLEKLPRGCEQFDTQRVNLLQFCVLSLDIMGHLDYLSQDRKRGIIDWIYKLQITDPVARAGFTGCTTLGTEYSKSCKVVSGHVAMTFSALVTLLTLGDDLSRVNRQSILEGIRTCQKSDGSFVPNWMEDGHDMRFVYCAVCVCYMLGDFSTIDVSKLVQFIKRNLTYDGSFSSGQNSEGHAGHTFCAVASLALLHKLEDTFSELEISRIVRHCVYLQDYGFKGRPNKSEDTCYSFWVGGTLAILKMLEFTDKEKNVDFILKNQNPLSGGIGKSDSSDADPLHTFMGLAGLSLMEYEGLNKVNPMLTMTYRAFKNLEHVKTKNCVLANEKL